MVVVVGMMVGGVEGQEACDAGGSKNNDPNCACIGECAVRNRGGILMYRCKTGSNCPNADAETNFDASGKSITSYNVGCEVELTVTRYKSGDFADVTVIPPYTFNEYDGDITLTGLPCLRTIGNHAFQQMTGKLSVTGDYPLLGSIGNAAFYLAQQSDSLVNFTNVPSLATIGKEAFGNFKGVLLLEGPLPALQEVGAKAFYYIASPTSRVVLQSLPMLRTIGQRAFWDYKGLLELSGPFNALTSIGAQAFWLATNPDNIVAIQCTDTSTGVAINGTDAFESFVGTHVPFGETCRCGDQCDVCAAGTLPPPLSLPLPLSSSPRLPSSPA
jgi:hypothetical protein